MERDFEKYRGGPTLHPADRLYVSINYQHVIIFNRKTYQMLGKPPAVFLYFSRSQDIIAVEPTHSPANAEAFPIRDNGPSSWRINAAPFCKHFGIRIDATERFAHPDFRDNRLILKLYETVTVAQQRRRKKRQLEK